jgi:lipid II:glycine glycyltransferase (peptidoglycan interpeptide bridge formation enzyme)
MSSLQNEALVPLDGDEKDLLARFTPRIRYRIRRCLKEDFKTDAYTDPDSLQRYWYLFEQTAEAKGFLRRPLSSFRRLFELGTAQRRVELCVLRTGERPIGASILARDAETTYYISGGRDTRLSKEFSYAAHYRLWQAMIRSREAGSRQFNLGAATGSIGEYKRQFGPEVRTNPTPVTLIVHPVRFALWKRTIMKDGQALLRGLIRKIGSRG